MLTVFAGYPLKVGKPLMCCVMTDTDRMDRLTGSVRSINLTLSPDKVKDTQVNNPFSANTYFNLDIFVICCSDSDERVF